MTAETATMGRHGKPGSDPVEVPWRPSEVGIPDSVSGYIDGRWVTDGGGPTLAVEDPALAVELGRVAEAGPEVVGRAGLAAAASSWRGYDALERGRILQRIGERLLDELEPLAALEARDTGKPLSQARFDVRAAARYFEYFGALADKVAGRVIPQSGSTLAYTAYEPYGVVGHITPWNSPLSQMCRGVAPSLAVGNAVIVKPSELTPFSSLRCAVLMSDAGLPAGACNILVGRGGTTGAALVANPLVRHISFTGSVITGRSVMRQAADRLVPCALELGGKSPLMVCDDADLALAAEAAVAAIVRNAGQSCLAPTRVLAQSAVKERLVELIDERMRVLTMGDPFEDPDIGPLVSAQQVERVEGYLKSAAEDGAHVMQPGDLSTTAARSPGRFVAPTLLVDVENSMKVAREEVFGPVQSVLTFGELTEGVSLANDTTYGLTATVFSADVSNCLRIARQLEAGQVHINGYPMAGPAVPFGGYKDSGIGREKGMEALLTYSQTKATVIHVS